MPLHTPLHHFAQRWATRGNEKGDTQIFWIELLQALGAEAPTSLLQFEIPIKIHRTTKFIDAIIPSASVLIEQKARGKSLTEKARQSDGTELTPYRQAARYDQHRPYSQHARWIVVCNFGELHIHNMEYPEAEPEIIYLENFPQEADRLAFLLPTTTGQPTESLRQRQEQLSLEAGQLVGKLYDLLLPQYKDPTAAHTLHSLNILCVRLVFCMYAEDAGLFGAPHAFCRYMERFATDTTLFREKLIQLFRLLDTPTAQRDPYMDEQLLAFPYVNGGLFQYVGIEVPHFTPDIISTLIKRAGFGFDWSDISPTIFGAVFESTLNPTTRRTGGMHYTSVDNIHRLIDPLFLDALRDQLATIRAERNTKKRRQQLLQFQERLATLRFLDPACGSGNFLTETYLSLRRLENEAIKSFLGNTHEMANMGGDLGAPIRVSIAQCYGIEINDFAAVVAKTALWIAESQMLRETESIIKQHIDFFPLRSYVNIIEGNALTTDWHTLTPTTPATNTSEPSDNSEYSDNSEQSDTPTPWYAQAQEAYIIGNPPFVGYSYQNPAQKADIRSIYVDAKGRPYRLAGKIDYVACWYFKAAQLMHHTSIRTAFVSTNSICQGEQVEGVWQPLVERFGIHLDFAHRTFQWDSESTDKAHVHCIIAGFSTTPSENKPRLYSEDGNVTLCDNLNFYLVNASNTFVVSRTKPLCDVPPMMYGNKPTDGGHFFLTPAERDELLAHEPEATPFVRRVWGADEFIKNKERYCLWLVNASPTTLRKLPRVMARIESVRQKRLASTKANTRKDADTPTLFQEIRQPESEYIIVPCVSSERRMYVPLGFIPSHEIATNSVQMIPSATLYHFGVLTSWAHNAWMRAVCGRLEMRYRYSKDIVYNNFPWPTPTPAQKAKIEATAQAILDARAQFPEASLADLYDPITMPPALRQAHRANDQAVQAAYGLPKPPTSAEEMAEAEPPLVAHLIALYQQLTAPNS